MIKIFIIGKSYLGKIRGAVSRVGMKLAGFIFIFRVKSSHRMRVGYSYT